jgi:hypothetical protein
VYVSPDILLKLEIAGYRECSLEFIIKEEPIVALSKGYCSLKLTEISNHDSLNPICTVTSSFLPPKIAQFNMSQDKIASRCKGKRQLKTDVTSMLRNRTSPPNLTH